MQDGDCNKSDKIIKEIKSYSWSEIKDCEIHNGNHGLSS